MGLVDGPNRVVGGVHVGEIVAGCVEILAHLYILFHVLDAYRPLEQLGQIVGDFAVALANLGRGDTIRHALVDAEDQWLGLALRKAERGQHGE